MLDSVRDVKASVWISASAGTGKTKSLIDRILALLLNRAEPSKILCLTYTKAAATEMLSRLSAFVRRFAQMSDTELIRELNSLGFGEKNLETAKKLYEKSRIPSEWVQIQTIHSFCFGILQKFPLETGLLPGVTICDDQLRFSLIDTAIEKVIFDPKNRHYCEYISYFGTDLRGIFKKKLLDIQKFFAKFDDFDALYSDFFNITHKEWIFSSTLDQHLLNMIFDGRCAQIFAELSDVFLSGSKEDIGKGQILAENSVNPSADFANAFLTKDGTLLQRLYTNTIAKRYPNYTDKIEKMAQKALEFCELRKNYVSAAANIAFFSVIRQVINEFSELKRANHCIDFDDVISMTSVLLNNIEWVMYKIDNSIEHLLIDEAQDTSPEQWGIINTITDEFFANYQTGKTVFVVGDEKQSIYSFQGADVQIFKKMHDHFQRRSESNGQHFHNVQLNKSYRTTGNILAFVDDIFKNTKHETNRCVTSGVVEIVDLFEKNPLPNESDVWSRIPLYEQAATETSDEKLAKYIAHFIRHTIDSRVFVESRNRAATESDFMILFQHRDITTMRKIIHHLRRQNLAVSGIDRTMLKDELIVKDLIVFAQFAVFPYDDLACACVFKSPIVGMTEEELMQLCISRNDASLWEHTLTHVEIAEKYGLFTLKNQIDQATQASAYDFFSQLLVNGTKEKFIDRFGEKCLESLNDFFDVIVAYEKDNNPSLQSFLSWFRTAGERIEVKHELYGDDNCIRLMTVHGSKGLQAPFVILADTHFYKNKSEKILKTDMNMLLWNFSSDMRTNATKQIYAEYDQAEQDESKRRLYVALTRAEDYLCILGQQQTRKNEKCWYNIIQQNADFEKFRKIERYDTLTVQRLGQVTECDVAPQFTSQEQGNFSIPDWYGNKNELPIATADPCKSAEMLYGDCVHLLLCELPKYKGKNCEFFADTIINDFDMSDDLKNRAKQEAIAIMHNPDFEFIFASDALSEISFLSGERENRIDKIAFYGNDLWIIDFKTGTYHKTTPREYVEQLRRYREVVSKVFVDKNIKTAILWTESAKLSEIATD